MLRIKRVRVEIERRDLPTYGVTQQMRTKGTSRRDQRPNLSCGTLKTILAVKSKSGRTCLNIGNILMWPFTNAPNELFGNPQISTCLGG